jgi:hypothetical protein
VAKAIIRVLVGVEAAADQNKRSCNHHYSAIVSVQIRKESQTMDLLSQETRAMYGAAFERRAAMVIENRNLLAGTRLVANYKKRTYVCAVEAGDSGEGVAFVLEDGSRFKSPSAAGSNVMGGKAVNGWRFWSLEGDGPAATEAVAKPAPKKGQVPQAHLPSAKPAGCARGQGEVLLQRLREGLSR